MALFDIEHPDTGAIITVESESAPTQEEAESLIASIPSTPIPVATPEQRFVQQYIKSEQAPALQQLIASAGRGATTVKDVVSTAVEGVQGLGEILGKASVEPEERTASQRLGEIIMSGIPGATVVPGFAGTLARAAPNLAQTGLEAVGRLGVDLSSLIGEAVQNARERPSSLVTNPIQTYIESLSPRTPSQEEAESAFAAQQQAQGESALANRQLVPEVLGEANVPLARAAPILATIPGAVGPAAALATRAAAPLTRVAARGLTVPTIEKATGLLGITETEGLTQLLEVAPARILEVNKTIPKTGKAAIQAATKAEDNLFNKAAASLSQAESDGLVMKGNSMVRNGRDAILNDFPSLSIESAEVENVLSKFKYLEKDIPPTQGQKYLRELNKRYDSLIDKNSPEASAYRAVRSGLSSQLDDIYKASSGLNESPYMDWGKVRQFKMGIQNRIEQTQRASGSAAVPVAAETPGISIGRGGAVLRAAAGRAARAARPLMKQGIEFIDEATESVFKGSPKPVAAPSLPEDVVASLRLQYSKTPPPSVPAGTTTSLVVANPLEEAIQETIRNLPREMRGRNERSIAEAILRSQQAP